MSSLFHDSAGGNPHADMSTYTWVVLNSGCSLLAIFTAYKLRARIVFTVGKPGVQIQWRGYGPVLKCIPYISLFLFYVFSSKLQSLPLCLSLPFQPSQ
jgi:hypothetical protein